MILTIDGGTTNTRMYLMQNGEICAVHKMPIGIRNTLQTDEKNRYFTMIAEKIAQLTMEYTIEAILCSGMIGSENGLYNCPHTAAPVSFAELAKQMRQVSLPDIANIPFWFIPGIKTFTEFPESATEISMDQLAEMDIMRGEETEIVGICASMGLNNERTYLLPGSHMKTVSVNSDGEITTFHTSLTGELLYAVAEHTILQASIKQAYPKTVDPIQLRRGYAMAQTYGMAQALFKVRILDKSVGGLTPDELYALLMGILLQEDVCRLIRDNHPVYIAGSDPFRSAYRDLLTYGGIPTMDIPEEIAECASAYGAWHLWQLHTSIFSEM